MAKVAAWYLHQRSDEKAGSSAQPGGEGLGSSRSRAQPASSSRHGAVQVIPDGKDLS